MKAETIAKYFLNKDADGTVFFDELKTLNNRTFYSGNARLNKYLHIAQNIYIAMYSSKLFDDDMYAYDNGAVVKSIQENYKYIKNTKAAYKEEIDQSIMIYLDKIYKLLANATLDELIDISHEDDEWIQKNKFYDLPNQKMDSLKMASEYKKQYADAIYVMEKI